MYIKCNRLAQKPKRVDVIIIVMSSLDLQVGLFTQYISNRFIMAGLIFCNWVSAKYDYVKGFVVKAVDGAFDAHRTKKWVFAQRNTVPWVVLEGKYENLNKPVFPLTYDPSSHTFTLDESDNSLTTRTHDHVVSAELVNDDSSLYIDISYIFHTVSWKGNYSAAPSLYEVVMVECLSSGFAFTEESLSKLTLSVMTADAMIIRVPLSSANSKMPFTEWNNYVFELIAPDSEKTESMTSVVAEGSASAATEEEESDPPKKSDPIEQLMLWAKTIQEKGDACRDAYRNACADACREPCADACREPCADACRAECSRM